MPTSTITDTTKFLSSQAQVFVTKNVTNFEDKSLPLLDQMEKHWGKGTKKLSGSIWEIPIASGSHSDETEFTTGFEPWNLIGRDIQSFGTERPRHFGMPIIMSGIEARTNSGAEAKIRIVKVRADSVMGTFRRRIHRRAFGVSGSGFTSLNTLNGYDFNTGFLEGAAVGSQTNTIHGIAKGTYATTPRMQNQFYDIGGAASINLRVGMNRVLIASKKVDGDKAKRVWYSDEDTYANLNRVLTPQEMYTSVGQRNEMTKTMTGAPLQFGGYEVFPTDDMPSNAGLPSATSPISLMLIDHDRFGFVCHDGAGNEASSGNGTLYFKTMEAERLSGYDAYYVPIWLSGQFLMIRPEGDLNLGTFALLINGRNWS